MASRPCSPQKEDERERERERKRDREGGERETKVFEPSDQSGGVTFVIAHTRRMLARQNEALRGKTCRMASHPRPPQRGGAQREGGRERERGERERREEDNRRQAFRPERHSRRILSSGGYCH